MTEHSPFDQGNDAPEHPETTDAGTPDLAGDRQTPTEATEQTGTPADEAADQVESSPGRGGFGDPPQ